PGPRADKMDEVYGRSPSACSRSQLRQVFWVGVAVDDPPSHHKRIEDTRLVPIVLDLVTTRDIDETRTKGMRLQTRRSKIIRLFRPAYEQAAVLSLADVSLLLPINYTTLSRLLLDHERATRQTAP